MPDNKKALLNTLVYHFLEMLVAFWIFFIGLGWFTTGAFELVDNFIFAFWVTVNGGMMLLIFFKILFPEISKKEPEQRAKVFKQRYMAIQLVVTITICFALFLMFFWVYSILRFDVPILPYWPTFWQAVAVSLGIGFVFASFCTLAVRYIIQLEKPPFQDS